MNPRLRIVLPSVIGVPSLPLILWDIHNARAIESMGMAWDVGAPIWPYQASDILLRALNAPAYSIAMPLATLCRVPAPMHLLLIAPAIVMSWWLLGLILDGGLTRWSRYPMCVLVITLLLWTASDTPSIFRDPLDYRPFDTSTALLVLRSVTPAAWFIALASLVCVKAKRVKSG